MKSIKLRNNIMIQQYMGFMNLWKLISKLYWEWFLKDVLTDYCEKLQYYGWNGKIASG